MNEDNVEVAIIGGGPAGLAAALALGRTCRRAVVFDAGEPRNAAATHIHNFVTRDGTPPAEFRSIGRAQLEQYESVSFRDERVRSIAGERDAFILKSESAEVRARRVLLCTGMVDEVLPLPGFEQAWGHSIYQCPYCHGWEVRGQRWGMLALDEAHLAFGFPAMLKQWSDDVVVFTGNLEVSKDTQAKLETFGVSVEPRRVVGLRTEGRALTHVQLEDGESIECRVLFAHPPQHQVEFVKSLELDLDDAGYVQVDPMTRETSRPGVYASGDLTSRAQGAIFAAATGTQAGAMINHELALAGQG